MAVEFLRVVRDRAPQLRDSLGEGGANGNEYWLSWSRGFRTRASSSFRVKSSDLLHFGPAHTDGDIVVVFPEKRTAYLGELFPDKAAPVIDTANGGSGVAFPETWPRRWRPSTEWTG